MDYRPTLRIDCDRKWRDHQFLHLLTPSNYLMAHFPWILRESPRHVPMGARIVSVCEFYVTTVAHADSESEKVVKMNELDSR